MILLNRNFSTNERNVFFMESQYSNEFDRIEYLNKLILSFLQSYSNGRNMVSGYLKMLNRNLEQPHSDEKLPILEKLNELFQSPQFIDYVEKLKEIKRIERHS